MANADKIPAPGTMAPSFTLPASDGQTIDLAGLRGKTVVLFFYPKADTPGCTKEACGFRDTSKDYAAAGAVVLGLSPDPVAKVKKFADKYHLGFPLLADADHAVCERYGVWQQKSMWGKKYMGVARTTFIISPDGKIAHVFEKVKPAGHEREVMERLKAAGTSK